jgi:hypothetical protein
MDLILIMILLILLFGGDFDYSRYGYCNGIGMVASCTAVEILRQRKLGKVGLHFTAAGPPIEGTPDWLPAWVLLRDLADV